MWYTYRGKNTVKKIIFVCLCCYGKWRRWNHRKDVFKLAQGCTNVSRIYLFCRLEIFLNVHTVILFLAIAIIIFKCIYIETLKKILLASVILPIRSELRDILIQPSIFKNRETVTHHFWSYLLHWDSVIFYQIYFQWQHFQLNTNILC